ncbi:MAG: hypothetical protein O7G85_01765 [Planctomycetota bacterium]|nr:hypothetical protein [Planctomycetota bacterium]
MSIVTSTPSHLARRLKQAQGFSLRDWFTIDRGTLKDYHELAPFHYKSNAPGAVTRVYVCTTTHPTVVGRCLGKQTERTLAAVVVVSLPHAGCVMRDQATNHRYRGLDLTSSMTMLNEEIRTISRVIVHPQFRGLGLSIRLVRHALDHAQTIYTEALAAMGRVHPFLQASGMTPYERPIRPEHARLLDALHRLDIEPARLAMVREVQSRIELLPDIDLHWIDRELRIWHRKACMQRSHKETPLDLHDLLKAARDRLLLRPMYYLWRRDEEAKDASHANST